MAEKGIMQKSSVPLVQKLVHVRCDLCGSDSTRTVMRKRAVLFDYEFPIVKCTVCGHVYVNPRLDDDAIEGLYDEAYYRGRGFDRTIQYTASEPDDYLRSRFEDEVATVQCALGGALAGKTILDVGCGAGGFVRALRLSGADSWGFDSSAYSSKLAAANGAPLIGEISDIIARGETYELVSAIEVIEHTTSPLEFLRFVRKLVKPGGVLFLETGNWNFVRLIPGTPYVMPEGHIHYFTPKTLSAFFAKAGFDTIHPLNFTWTGWRRFGKQLGGVGVPLTASASMIARTLIPQFSPFPLARRPTSG